MSRRLVPALAATPLLLAIGLPLAGQQSPARATLDAESWTRPSDPIVSAVLAPRWENVSVSNVSPDGAWFVHTVSDGPPSMAIFAKPHLNLGAFQVDPAADRHRRLTTRSDVGYHLVSTTDGRRVEVEIPDGARVSGAEWSPDGTRLAFLGHFDDRSHVYVADPASGESRRITTQPILATHVTGIEWTSNGREVVVVLPPENRGAMPEAPAVPETPMVRHTTDVENRLRTYFDLLESPYEKALVRYFSTGQVAAIDVESREVTRIGPAAMITGIDPSPSGDLFRVKMLTGELSYIVPVTSSAEKEELWSRDGTVIALLAEREARESAVDDDDDDEEGDDGIPERRNLSWTPDGTGLVFARMDPRPDAEDGDTTDSDAAADTTTEEDAEDRAPRMDRVYRWIAPFGENDIEEIYSTRQRLSSFAFDAEGGLLFLTRGGQGGQTVHAVDLAAPDEEYLIVEREEDAEITEDPGSVMYMAAPNGVGVVRTTPDGRHAFLSGTRYFEDPTVDAPRPFVDRIEIRTGETERVFESSAEMYEEVEAVLDREVNTVIVERQSPTMVPQAFRVALDGDGEARLTENVDHTPELTATRRESFMVERPDGFTSKVEVTMPPGWQPGDAAPPAMFWFYPREYEDQESYDERSLARFNRNDFPNLGTRSMEIMALRGYAVVDPDLPIVGDSDQPNDRYIVDLRNTLGTVIDSLDARGLVDRGRLGLGGHSYGAFGAVNAMVNTPYFKAGIAGDGNYNRSLTPAGFQREPRQLWEAEQIYIEMSPFFFADRLTGSLLMYHGMDDHNVGTHPDHSRRLFHALNVLGKEASLYMYPFEDHGPATRETLLDLWARWEAWLEVHLKGEQPRAITEQEDGEGGS